MYGSVIYANPDANDVQDVFSIIPSPATVAVHVAAVPEPAPFAMPAGGLLTLGLLRRFGRIPRSKKNIGNPLLL